MKIKTIVAVLLLPALLSVETFAQDSTNVSTFKKPEAHFPEIKGYVGLVHPIYTWSKDGNVSNFTDYYLVGNPWGINIWKSKKVGISFEFTPFVRTDKNGSKVSNIQFHPGVLYRLGHEFTLIGRLAYETSGRYGVTPILNKVLLRGKNNTFFVAALAPIRFGNNHAPAVSAAFQFGVGF
jgi:hypothetical protein